MALAIFDLDNTLLGGDSDHAWGEFLYEKGIVGEGYRRRNDAYYEDYLAERLNVVEYIEFTLEPLTAYRLDELGALQREFMARKIKPMRLPKAEALLAEHRDKGDRLLIMTSTNRLITEPIAASLQVDELLATELEIDDNRLTGRLAGRPCSGEGKVLRLKERLAETGESLRGSSFYTDSINDLPLLEIVDHPVAVDPDDSLRNLAASRGWKVMSLR